MKFSVFNYLPAWLILLFIISSIPSYGQFNQLIFKKQLHVMKDNFSVRHNPVQPLGDQNNDGFDDFLVKDCYEALSYIFLGSNPVDTIPDFLISGEWRNFNLLDVNNDSQKDLVFLFYDRIIKIYFGGSLLDTIPDIIFDFPHAASNTFGVYSLTLNDFNGDGRSELMYFDTYLPGNGNKRYGAVYIYNTESIFDTIPHYSFFGDTTSNLLYWTLGHSGDINGDGLTDFSISGKKNSIYFQSYYLGNSNFVLNPSVTYYENEHHFEPRSFQIVKDINKDGKDDFIIPDYGFYPYYFREAVLKGSFPIDTIPDWGLNSQNLGLLSASVITAGDVNGDGFNDFVGSTGGSPPSIKLWLGGRNIHQIADKTWYGNDQTNFACAYGAPGDINGDGTDDIAIWDKYWWPAAYCGTANLYIFNGDTTLKADTILVGTDVENIFPNEYFLKEPYPNPFNSNTIISWSLPERNLVTIKIYDVLGNEITTLLNAEKFSGEHKIEFNAAKYNLSSGVYFLKLECYNRGAVTFKSTKKLSYLK